MEDNNMNKIKLGIKVHHDFYQALEHVPTRDLSEIDYIVVRITSLVNIQHYMVSNSTCNFRIQQLTDINKILNSEPTEIYDDENGCMINNANTLYITIRPEQDGTVSDIEMAKVGKLIQSLTRLLQIPQNNILVDHTKYKEAQAKFWQTLDKLNLE